MVAGEEEFHGLKILEQFFEAAIVEELSRLAPSTGSQLDGAMTMNAEGVRGHGFRALVVVKDREQAGAGPQHGAQAIHHNRQQSRREVFQDVPYQRAVEGLVGEVERGVEKRLDCARVGLVFVKISLTETVVKLKQKVVGVEKVPVVGDEADSALVGSGEIQNRHSGALLQR